MAPSPYPGVEAVQPHRDVVLARDGLASQASTAPVSTVKPSMKPEPSDGAGLSDATSSAVSRQPAGREVLAKPVPARRQGAVRRPAAAARPLFPGSLVVRSRPAGASVFLNGRFVGTTPLTLRDQSAGSRAVRVTLDGYDPWTTAAQIVAYRQNVVTANLHQRPRPSDRDGS
jgi:hypothetical protein